MPPLLFEGEFRHDFIDKWGTSPYTIGVRSLSFALSTSVGELEPVYDFPGGNEWFSSARTTVALRPGPHVQALLTSRYASGWCDNCGRRRGADGRCVACDPWWTSPFYVYGSLTVLSVTAILLTVIPMLRRPVAIARHNPGVTNVAVLQSNTTWGSAPPAVSVPNVLPAFRSVSPTAPVIVVPTPSLRTLPPPNADDTASLSELARLRAMTDFAAGAETRRAVSRALSGAPPPTTFVAPPRLVTPVAAPPLPAAPMPDAIDAANAHNPEGEQSI